MPNLPINFGKNKNIDEIGLSTHGAAMVDAFVDRDGNVNRRPGYAELCDLSTGSAVDGLFWWDRQSKVIAVSGGRCFQITASDGTFTELTGDSFQSGTRVKFADFGTALYAANGEHIMKIGTGSTFESVYDDHDSDSPADVSHVVFVDKYLIGNDIDSGLIYYSANNDPDTWETRYVEAEYKPDYIMAVGASHGELMLLGKTSLEPFYNTGLYSTTESAFAPVTHARIESGTVAKYSFVWAKDRWMWLDNYRSVVFLDGRTARQFSPTLDKYLQSFSTVHDAEADYLPISGKPYYILSFPTEGKTIVCDLDLGIWYEWGKWNSGTSSYDRWEGNCGCYAQSWNKTLIGDRSSGKVYVISNDTDNDDGDDIRWLIRTPQIDYGTQSEHKFIKSLVLHFRKTESTETTVTPKVSVKWRDNGKTTWRGNHTITLEAIGQTAFRGKKNRLGRYFSRQYEFSSVDDAPAMCFVRAEENF